MEKLIGPECPNCGCRDSHPINTKRATIYRRQPGSTQLLVVKQELRHLRSCDHCRRQFTTIETQDRAQPVAAAVPCCHFCGSTNLRELSKSPPTRSGIVYGKCQCLDCRRAFSLTTRPAA